MEGLSVAQSQENPLLLEKLLQPGESMKARAAAYWVPLCIPLTCFAIVAVASLVPVYRAAAGYLAAPLPPLAIALFTIFPLVCVPLFCLQLGHITTRLGFTDTRFLAFRWRFIPSNMQVDLNQITGIEVLMNSSGKTFGYGTITIIFADRTGQRFRFIRNPQAFAQALSLAAGLPELK